MMSNNQWPPAAGDPHAHQPIHTTGTPLAEAETAVLLLHGRGGTADGILSLAAEVERPHLAYLAPQAAGQTWYPYGFLAPVRRNEPYLSSALSLLNRVLAEVEAAGIPARRIVLLGFSQGACLASEYVARHPQRYGGLAALSGGLIGQSGEGTGSDQAENVFRYEGSLAGTPIFLGCSDTDPHIPRERVEKSARVFQDLGAEVAVRLYPGMPHTVNQDEISQVRQLLDRAAQ